jgi:hypothetical protein
MKEDYGHRITNLQEGKRLIGLKSTAYKEYLAARHLLNSDFLHKAGSFINTSLEKEIKAYLFACEMPVNVSHDSFKLLMLLKGVRERIFTQLNSDFFKMISKIYLSRYYENLSPGYNFVIIRNKFLAELDHSYSVLESKTRFKKGSQLEIPKTQYELDIEKKNPILLRNNYVLNNIDKEIFLMVQTLCTNSE